MRVFNHADFDGHERVVFCTDPDSDLKAIIAIHDTRRGPALGGCRMWPYASAELAVRDVLRLSRGMTYKAVMAGLELGGGKSVIIGDPRTGKSEALLRAMGRFVNSLDGGYIVAEDSGTCVADMKVIAAETAHVAGVSDKPALGGGTRSGDPSPSTAYGVFVGLKAAVRHRLGRYDLDGVRVAIQGTGSVGTHLARLLHGAGAELLLADLRPERAQALADELGAEAVAVDAVFDQDVDVFAPCALGAVLNDDTVKRLRAAVVAGAANNQLDHERHGEALRKRGILYAPDYVINAGGLIDVAYERSGIARDGDRLRQHIDGIAGTLSEIFVQADAEGLPTGVVADQLARHRLQRRH
ncbi:amino acid dehydrogenase [Azospirillum sp. TSO22-1]|nr:Glu/Leu/Phe/Val dehydrogenase dimerization domain-containing protein [Azospirillum sp. TSO22-1]PWC31822.1 amino acid dehydrogenase [Azospirillum sp. TSO22-1]